jgi:hypothetical protein
VAEATAELIGREVRLGLRGESSSRRRVLNDCVGFSYGFQQAGLHGVRNPLEENRFMFRRELCFQVSRRLGRG